MDKMPIIAPAIAVLCFAFNMGMSGMGTCLAAIVCPVGFEQSVFIVGFIQLILNYPLFPIIKLWVLIWSILLLKKSHEYK